ncbi:MAG TPA: hypothetical protein VGZ22_28755 [Isosphaeraceae bacterium]|jgi:hypothetical protein|nr:hypothetical protein [Isosphaeraceae bacterium]
MKFASVTQEHRRHPELTTLTVSGFGVVGLIVLVVCAGRLIQRAETASALSAGPEAPMDVRPAASPAAKDLEPVVIDVEATGLAFQVGSRRIADAKELTQVLRPLAGKADAAFVRVSDDAPISLAAGALQACRDAGFSSVSYVPAPAAD